MPHLAVGNDLTDTKNKLKEFKPATINTYFTKYLIVIAICNIITHQLVTFNAKSLARDNMSKIKIGRVPAQIILLFKS